MTFVGLLYDLLRHLGEDGKWRALLDYIGTANVYVVLFLIVFAETGLVILPFLPGDSLLFALGAMSARDIGIQLPLVTVLLIVAAIVGDAVNYTIGYRAGPAIFRREDSRLLNRRHLLAAQAFYEKHGGKTIILARFVPIIRTFAPFVAGIGKMNYFRFAVYNVTGGIAWVLLCVLAGRMFGGFEFVKRHFELVLVAVVAISVLPMGVEFVRARSASRRGVDPLVEATTIGEPADDAASR